MFSEVIWVYYAIVMFTSVKWNEPAFFDLTWIMVAGVLGYTLNYLLANRSNHLLLFAANILIIAFIVLLNWRSVVPEGIWGFGLAVSIGIGFIFIRSARLVYRQPDRRAILQHFEGNVMLYIVFVLVFAGNQWSNEMFHLFFIVAIVSSLLGMILTLHKHEDSEGNQKIKIMKVGHSRWFAGVVIVLFICIPLFSLTLLLPSVNNVIFSLGMGIWEGLKWLSQGIASFFSWLSSLVPPPEMEVIPSIPEEPTIPPSASEGTINYLPSKKIVTGTIILLFLIALWFFSKAILDRRILKPTKLKDIIITKESWWANFIRGLKSYLQYLSLKWRRRFPFFYYESIYWHYHQVLRWGKKNGSPRLKSETSQEYVKRLINYIPLKDNSFSYKGRDYQIADLLKRLNEDYQATYYGLKEKNSGEKEYKLLIAHLGSIRLKDSKLSDKVLPT